MESRHSTLDSAVVERKARLAKLASLKRKQPDSDKTETAATTISQEGQKQARPTGADTKHNTDIYLSGRNYARETRGPKLGFENAPSGGQATLEEQAAAVQAETAEQAENDEAATAEKGIDLFKLQPKKPNWDLKRDLDAKMKILNVRTQNAIANLVRDRIEKAKEDAQAKSGPAAKPESWELIGEEVGMEGNTLVESVHLRENEIAAENRHEEELDEDDTE